MGNGRNTYRIGAVMVYNPNGKGRGLMIIAEGILPLNFEPEIGDLYETHNSRVIGWVVEKVPNKTGSVRLRLRLDDLSIRWTTWVPR